MSRLRGGQRLFQENGTRARIIRVLGVKLRSNVSRPLVLSRRQEAHGQTVFGIRSHGALRVVFDHSLEIGDRLFVVLLLECYGAEVVETVGHET